MIEYSNLYWVQIFKLVSSNVPCEMLWMKLKFQLFWTLKEVLSLKLFEKDIVNVRGKNLKLANLFSPRTIAYIPIDVGPRERFTFSPMNACKTNRLKQY